MRNRLSGIYRIRNLVNNKCYYGSAVNFTRRSSHFRLLETGSHYNKHLQNAGNKYGKENFVFEVVEIILETKLDLRKDIEQVYLDILEPWKSEIGYNVSNAATGFSSGQSHPSFGKDYSGKNNKMYGKCAYDVWVEKYGIEEADRRYVETSARKSIATSGVNNYKYINLSLEENNLRKLYWDEKLSLREAGLHYSCSRATIARAFRDLGIPFRNRSDRHKKRL